MKTKITLFTLVMMFVLNVNSQTTSYYSGFDNTAETTGWTNHRMGSTANGGWSVSTVGPYSPTKCIIHFYPVGGSSVTDDWYVSPAFNFPTGGNIDSVRTNFSGFGIPNSGDIVAIYLLRGSATPTLTSSDTMLFDFRGVDYVADNTWRLKTNITIPPVAGTCYIAFRYQTTINWLDVKFDNLKISGNSGAGINGVNTDDKITLFPNPALAGQSIQIKNEHKEKLTVKVYSVSGSLVYEKEISGDAEINIGQPCGSYFYQVENNKKEVIRSGKLVVQ